MSDEIQIQALGIQEARAHLERSRRALEMAPRTAVHAAAMVLKKALKDAAPASPPRQPGQEPSYTQSLKDSIDFDLDEGTLNAALAHFKAKKTAMFVIEGTAPHDIWAGFYTGKSNSKSLHFFVGGGHEVFAPYVRHPGTKPNDFRKKAWESAREEVMAILRHTGSAVLRGEMIREFGVGI